MGELDYSDPEPLYELRGHRGSVLSLCFSPDGRSLVTGGLDSHLLFYQLGRVSHHYRLKGHTDLVHSVHFAADSYDGRNGFILSGSRDKTVRLWRMNSALNKPEVDERSPIIYHCGSTIRHVHSSPDAQSFCTGSDDKSVKVWSTQVPNKRLQTLLGHTNWIKCCKFSNLHDQLLASCGDDSSLKLYDLRLNGRKGACIKTIEATRNRHFTYLDWFPKTSHFIAVASSNAMIRIYDLRNLANIVQFYTPHQDSINCVNFHSSGNYLLSCSSDRSCKLIDVVEGRVLYTLRGHSKPLFGCAFDPKGEHFATGGGDLGVRLWRSNLRTSHSNGELSTNYDYEPSRMFKSDAERGDDESVLEPHLQEETTLSNKVHSGNDCRSFADNSFEQNDCSVVADIDPFDSVSLDRATVIRESSRLSEIKSRIDSRTDISRCKCEETKLRKCSNPQVTEKYSLAQAKSLNPIKISSNQINNQEMHELLLNMFSHIETLTDTMTRLETRISSLEGKIL